MMTIHPTSFVEFPQGAVEGAVGFKETVADDVLDKIKAQSISVGGAPVVWERVDGEFLSPLSFPPAIFHVRAVH